MRVMTMVLITLAVSACQMTYSTNRSVVVKGPQSTEERYRIAEQVGTDLYQHTLRGAVKERFGLSDEQLEGLYVRWQTTNYTNIIGNKLPKEPVVTLNVGIQHRGEIKNAEEIAVFCAELTRQALATRGLSVGAQLPAAPNANPQLAILFASPVRAGVLQTSTVARAGSNECYPT
jgi:hypothetical protein